MRALKSRLEKLERLPAPKLARTVRDLSDEQLIASILMDTLAECGPGADFETVKAKHIETYPDSSLFDPEVIAQTNLHTGCPSPEAIFERIQAKRRCIG